MQSIVVHILSTNNSNLLFYSLMFFSHLCLNSKEVVFTKVSMYLYLSLHNQGVMDFPNSYHPVFSLYLGSSFPDILTHIPLILAPLPLPLPPIQRQLVNNFIRCIHWKVNCIPSSPYNFSTY